MRLASFALLALLLAGCASPLAADDSPNANSQASGEGDASEALRIGANTTEIPGSLRASVGTPAYTASGEDVLHTFADEIIERNITGYIVEVVWTHASPASHELTMWLRAAPEGFPLPTDDPEPQALAQGASPLRLEIPIETLTAEHYSVFIRPTRDPVGASIAQDFVAYVTAFEGVPFDATFTALSAEPHH